MFEILFDKKVCEHVVKLSVLFANQNNRHSFIFSNECLKNFKQQSVSRWSKIGKEKVKVDHPICIATHNKWMGGVDRWTGLSTNTE